MKLGTFLSVSILVWIVGMSAAAQSRNKKSPHEFSFIAGGGLSSMQYTPAAGKQKPGFGGMFGVGYRYFFLPRWSAGTGAGIALHIARTEVSNCNFTENAAAGDGSVFEFTYSYGNYKGRSEVIFFEVPVTVQYQSEGKIAYYGNIGVKAGIPLNAQYEASGNLETTGYFPDLQVAVKSNLPDFGFGTYRTDRRIDTNLKTAFMATLETGAAWSFNDGWMLYTGVYADYGLNDISVAKSASLITYQPDRPSEFAYGNSTDTSDKLYPLAAGIILRLSFRL